MSSPLESLKKNKKAPLNGAERLSKAPYRRKVLDASDVLNSTTHNSTERGTKACNDFQAPTDMELLSSMAGRLAQTEQQLRYSTKELIDKDKKIRILEEKVQLLEKARGYSSDTVRDLEERCKSLQEQVYDMEEFLADYGMIWVGPDDVGPSNSDVKQDNMATRSDTGNVSTQGVWSPGSSLASKSFEINFNLVVKNIEELNHLSGYGSAVVSQTKAGATFKSRDLVPLTLYANGILMFSGPFRPYTEETTQRCMQDIMDGYFPSELETRYPEGVPFKVIDKREVVFKDRRTELLFPGSGQPLDSNTKGPSSSNTRIHTLNETKEHQECKISMDRFLNKLPSSVIKDGKIIDVRCGIADTLKGSSANSEENKVTLIDTPVIKEIKSRVKSGVERPSSGHHVTTLRIKSENGDQTYILKLRFTDTIGDVRHYINKMRPELCDNYSIKTSFPNKVHEDPRLTLEQAELIPNATLHILLRK